MVIILPTLTGKYSQYGEMANIATSAFVLVTFMQASCKNPGYLKPHDGQSLLDLLRDINPLDICADCQVIKSARSRHCAICNRCVERFDHHCPWINNCVGIKNHNAFFSFLFSIWAKILFTIVSDGYSGWSFYNQEENACIDT